MSAGRGLPVLVALVFAWSAPCGEGDKSPAPPNPAEVAGAVESLGNPQFEKREKGYRLLLAWGIDWPDRVAPSLMQPSPDPEIQARKDRLLQEIEQGRLWRPWETLFGQEAASAALDKDPKIRPERDKIIEKARKAVRELIETPSPERIHVVTQACDWCQEEAAELILHYRCHPDPEVRLRVADSLWRFPRKRAYPKLADLLSDKEPEVRLAALECMIRLGDFSCADRAATMTGDPDPRVRRSVIRLLARTGDRRFVPSISPALEDRDRDVRGNAAAALGDLGGREHIPAIASFLEAEDVWLQACAATSLGKLTGHSWTWSKEGIEAARNWWKEHRGEKDSAPAGK